MKIDKSKLLVVLDDEYEDMTPDELRAELPEHQPRYVLYSYCYHHDDGRISYPQVYVHIHPEGCQPELSMMYSGSNNYVVQAIGVTKHFELRDLDEFTEEWMQKKLKFFR
ncbi:glia maturation factor beta-like isoform X2 [Lytechinus pictus]|uniref:glia maturation factor beta-like isoform X1 n=1 Tax=Lytechinus pictus TaxID=7653 RepID=UPI0030BA1479